MQKEIAIISLGMSCQTAHQLRVNQPMLEKYGIPAGAVFSNYFDWLICPPNSAAHLLESGMPRFTRDDITLKAQPFWNDYELYFWHEFRNNNIVDIDEHFEFAQQKFDYLREKFSKLRHYKRLVCILSNTQGNLPQVHDETGELDFIFDDAKIQRLKTALENYLSRNVEILVVTNKDRFEGSAGKGYEIEFMDNDETEWKGDDNAWENCLKRYFVGNLNHRK